MEDTKKPLIIFDTDMDTDCDDAGALSMVYEYVKRGRAELLGIVADAVSPYAAACCEALGAFYGINRPVGTVSAASFPENETDRYARYCEHSASMGTRQYNIRMADRVGKRDTDYPSAARVYRTLLSSAPDGSVTVVCVGMLTALENLLLSEGDDISPLSGKELLLQKVCKVVSMGYPAKEGDNFNWDMDGAGAQTFLSGCPVPVYVSGAGGSIITGKYLSERLPAEHPLRQIYETYNGGPGRGRASWDLVATLYALEPGVPLLTAVERGTCCYDPSVPHSYWEVDGKRRDYEILPTVSDEELAAFLEDRMAGCF